MKHYIETHQNGKQLLGSDFTLVFNDFRAYPGATIVRNRIAQLEKRIESLKPIKPYLNTGKIEFHYKNEKTLWTQLI
jgi:hypothetical protein